LDIGQERYVWTEDREQEVEGRAQKQREIEGCCDVLLLFAALLGWYYVRSSEAPSLATLDPGKAKERSWVVEA
jgi:hypothetical protein